MEIVERNAQGARALDQLNCLWTVAAVVVNHSGLKWFLCVKLQLKTVDILSHQIINFSVVGVVFFFFFGLGRKNRVKQNCVSSCFCVAEYIKPR